MSISQQLTIQLPHFEGPMALLLHLIRKDEMETAVAAVALRGPEPEPAT